MRVTMQSIYANILTNLNKVNGDMNRINQQISSGKQMSKISDNPVNLINALGLRTNLAEIGQYQKNIQYGNTVINASETALTETKDLVMRAKTLAIQLANAPMTAGNRENAAMEVKNLWDQAIILANSAVNGKHIFGGFRTIGYTPAEPAPFVQGARDGYFVNGANPAPQGITGPLSGKGVDNSQNLVPGDLLINGHDVTALHDRPEPVTTGIPDTTHPDSADLSPDDLQINGQDIGAVDLTGGGDNEGINMAGAFNLREAINAVSADTGVTASLTTLTTGIPVDATNLTAGDTVSFSVNGITVEYTVQGGDVGNDALFATNLADQATTVLAANGRRIAVDVGDATNGGAANALVFRNLDPGNETAITIADLDGNFAGAASTSDLGLDAIIGENSTDAGNNTGQVTLTATNSYTITTDAVDDSILNAIGLSSPDTDGQITMNPVIHLQQNDTHGLNMASAAALAAAVNDPAVQNLTGVSAKLTTLTYAETATADATADGSISFYLNGEFVGVAVTNGDSAADINDRLVAAINAKSDLTGVTGGIGDDNNGAPAGTLILKNLKEGDDRDIVITSFNNSAAGTNLNLADGSHQAAAGNTGKVSLVGDNAFTISTSAALDNPPSDDILALIGLAGGDLGFADIPDDGILRYGPALQEGDLLINGKPVTTADDGVSTIYADASAAAKAAAINNGNYKVTAEVEPAWLQAAGPVQGGSEASRLSGIIGDNINIPAGDLAINGIVTTMDLPVLNLEVNGLHMQRAADIKATVNAISSQSGVSANLTTLYAGGETDHSGGTTNIDFTLNGTAIKVNANGANNEEVARQVIDAINAQSELTGVTAQRGTDHNGGVLNSIVLKNSLPGDETAIELAGLTAAMTARTGLDNGSHDLTTGNTGRITFNSEEAFLLSSPNHLDSNDILKELGVVAPDEPIILNSGATGAIANNFDILSGGDLAINGFTTNLDVFQSAASHGLYMDRAWDMQAAINNISADTDVTAALTTLHSGAPVSMDGQPEMSFTLNGVSIEFTANGETPDDIVQQTITAINTRTGSTGVVALRGDGNNGGESGSIVLQNFHPGDETDIVLAGLDPLETDRIGLGNGTNTALDANTGQITLLSDEPIHISSPNNLDVVGELGLTTGVGDADDTTVAENGRLEYGSAPAYLNRDDLVINGVSIFDKATAISGQDATNSLVAAINAKQEQTGVAAGRDGSGQLVLSALDGRNIHLQTTARGEKVTQLTGSVDADGKAMAGDEVHFGSVRLWSEQPFKLESGQVGEDDDTIIDTGFEALGLTGELTGQDDIREDNLIQVKTIHRDNDYVRYAGDRDNDIAIKVGQHSTIEISKNGFDAVYQSGVFNILKDLEDVLLGDKFRTATSAAQAGNIHATLDSGETGLELEERIQAGTFRVAVTDHHQVPPRERLVSIRINPENDTLADIAQRLNGVPGLNAKWDDSGYLQLNSSEERYSFDLKNDTSGLLDATGLKFDNLQASGLSKSIADLDDLLNELTNQIADFGARANRMDVQTNIYMNLQLANSENLSELEDTDLMEAIMQLKAKEVAYQAALNAAAKTMQLSLVNFL